MPSNREAYFEAIKSDVPKSVVEFALKEINGLDSVGLINEFDKELKDYKYFRDIINRYKRGEMIEHVFGKAYFLSVPFFVNKNVLIPRQETEQLVIRTIEIIKDIFKDQQIAIADVCTGSGCIGISIARTLQNNIYCLTDISDKALFVAKKNVESLLDGNVSINLVLGDMLEPLMDKKIDVLVCNPPYISDVEQIDKKTWEQEPHLALLANPSTLFYEKVLKDCHLIMNKQFLLAFEIGEDMESSLKPLVEKYCEGATYWFEKDIYGKTRFLFIKQ